MDIKEQFINSILEKLREHLDDSTTTLLQDCLVIELNNYEITEKCTDLVVTHDTSEVFMKKFVIAKYIEGLSDSTVKRYVEENKKLVNFLNKPIEDITTFDIRYYLASRRKVGVSNRTLDGMRRCYSTFYGWLYKEGLISNNPCFGLTQIKYKKDIKKPFSAIELEKIRMGCESKRDLALVSFLYSTGCRVSEVSRLNIDDINFETKECIVLGKGNKERTVYLTDVAVLHLQNYLKSRNDRHDALFIGKGTKRLKKTGIESLLKRIEKKTGVENVHPHRFRRTLATNLIDKGMNIQDVAEILGHVDIKTTQVYCYVNKTNVKNAYIKYAA